ncbi:hypothetical protein AJ80_07259 [Polytolypa hystricis UAMH7299]|uniref:N-acetyltransferase domain-containing protein n=1 Tax=Polytolypa hystricis (strain UAMH7299) TaxID=1447883 RepID=A0A2B7XRN1_POLH7|nr:hypothetical protein AJ80_07259 [Polytolypa hystricis UAMH7299]
MPVQPTTIYDYKEPYAPLIALLTSHLPFSGPLLRRIQHHLLHPSPTAQILATFPPSTTAALQPPRPWMVFYVDIYRGLETQCWLYSSLEREVKFSTKEQLADDRLSELNTTPENEDKARSQLLGLLSYIRTEMLPPYISWRASQTDTKKFNNLDHQLLAHPPSAVLVGSLHSGLFALLTKLDSGGVSSEFPRIKILRGGTFPNIKYLFRCPIYQPQKDSSISSGSNSSSLPPGYRFCDRHGRQGVPRQHLGLVISHTNIPRLEETLAQMPSVALYYNSTEADRTQTNGGKQAQDIEQPIAWCFLGSDASLCTLHVEPEHRGKGLAMLVAKEAMRRGMGVKGGFGQDDEAGLAMSLGDVEKWVFADVAVENAASRRAMEKIGGEMGWTVNWAAIELFPDVYI